MISSWNWGREVITPNFLSAEVRLVHAGGKLGVINQLNGRRNRFNGFLLWVKPKLGHSEGW